MDEDRKDTGDVKKVGSWRLAVSSWQLAVSSWQLAVSS